MDSAKSFGACCPQHTDLSPPAVPPWCPHVSPGPFHWYLSYLLNAFIQQVNFSQSVEWDEPYVLLYHLKRIMDCGACFSCWDTCESRPNLEVVQSECVRWLLARWSTTPFKNHSPFQHLSALKGSQRRGVTKPTTQKLSEQTLKCLWGISADISPHFVLS